MPLPCQGAAGKPVRPKALPFWHDHFDCAGSVELDLAGDLQLAVAGAGGRTAQGASKQRVRRRSVTIVRSQNAELKINRAVVGERDTKHHGR